MKQSRKEQLLEEVEVVKTIVAQRIPLGEELEDFAYLERIKNLICSMEEKNLNVWSIRGALRRIQIRHLPEAPKPKRTELRDLEAFVKGNVIGQQRGVPKPHHLKATREKALNCFKAGLGYKATATQLGLNRDTVKCWLRKYKDGTFVL